MDNESKIMNKLIDYLRFPLVVLVVYIHGFGDAEVNWNCSVGYDLYEYVRITLSKVLGQIAVPLFFLFSGYLFFNNMENWCTGTFISKLRRRIRTILIPFILWNTCQLILVFCLYLNNIINRRLVFDDFLNYLSDHGWIHLFWNCNVWNSGYNVFGDSVQCSGPVLLPFWYMRDLIVLVLLSPLIYYLLKKWKYIFAALIFIAYVLGVKFNIIGVTVFGLFFYCIGASVAIHKWNIVYELRAWKWIMYYFAVVLSFFGVLFCERETPFEVIIFNLYVVIAVFAVIVAASALIKGREVNPLFPKMSFFVYASYPLLILYLSELVFSRLFPKTNWWIMVVDYLMAPLLAVLICCGIYLFLKRYMDKVLILLTGGRDS